VRLASRGQRDLDAGVESIADESERTQVRRQGRAVQLKALGAAVGLTLLALAV